MADFWTLAGVLVGGLITAGSNWWLTDLKSKADEKKEQRARENERKRTVRLIYGELALIRSVLRMVVSHEEWSPEYEPQLSLAFWKHYAPALAAELNEEAWAAVLLAYTSVEITMSEVRALAPKELIAEQVKGLAGDIETITRALALLEGLYATKPSRTPGSDERAATRLNPSD